MDVTTNFIENIYRDLREEITPEYAELYAYTSNDKLREILSTLHAGLVNNFKIMNERLPTNEYEQHFWADPSRDLIKYIEMSKRLQRGLKNTPFSLEVDEYYEKVITICSQFLRKSGGSPIPKNMEKITLYYKLPIFKPAGVLEIQSDPISYVALKPIGEGSYARVYTYTDEFYGQKFVLKRAKADLNDKELLRFKQEFEKMSEMSSPYVLRVYRYNDEKHEYIMEYMDYSLCDYITKFNSTLTTNARKHIGLQVLKAMTYIHSKGLFHRDISPKNILIKEYEDTLVVKIADFGLVKVPNSDLTSLQTDMKGSFNDPGLVIDGFANYDLSHEIYSLTKLLCYIMTGKINLDNISDEKIKKFISIGMNPDKSERYKSLNDLKEAFWNL